MDERIAELEQEIAHQERLVALLPTNAVAPSRKEGERQIEQLRNLLAYETARRDAEATGQPFNRQAYRWALAKGKSHAEALAAALA